MSRILSTMGGVSASVHAGIHTPWTDNPRQTPPPGRHPLARHPPGQTPLGRHPPGKTPPSRSLLLQMVHILLECILAIFLSFAKHSLVHMSCGTFSVTLLIEISAVADLRGDTPGTPTFMAQNPGSTPAVTVLIEISACRQGENQAHMLYLDSFIHISVAKEPISP